MYINFSKDRLLVRINDIASVFIISSFGFKQLFKFVFNRILKGGWDNNSTLISLRFVWSLEFLKKKCVWDCENLLFFKSIYTLTPFWMKGLKQHRVTRPE